MFLFSLFVCLFVFVKFWQNLQFTHFISFLNKIYLSQNWPEDLSLLLLFDDALHSRNQKIKWLSVVG